MHRASWLVIMGGAVALLVASGSATTALRAASSEPEAPPGQGSSGSQDRQRLERLDRRAARDQQPGESRGPVDRRGDPGSAKDGSDRPGFRPGLGLWRGDGSRSDWSSRLSTEDMDRLMDLAVQIDPQRGERLRQMRQDNPESFKRWVMQSGRRLAGLLELKRRNPELFTERLCELQGEVESNRLGRQWQAARDAGSKGEMERLERQMRQIVQEQVDCGIKARALEMIQLEAHLKNLRQQLEADARDGSRLVEQRVQALMTAEPREPSDRIDEDDRTDGGRRPDAPAADAGKLQPRP